jgi:hypothetical protein
MHVPDSRCQYVDSWEALHQTLEYVDEKRISGMASQRR